MADLPNELITPQRLFNKNARQLEAWEASLEHRFLLYGGAAGGGKSFFYAGGVLSICFGSINLAYQALKSCWRVRTTLRSSIAKSARYAMSSLESLASSGKARHAISFCMMSTVVAGFFCATSTIPRSIFQPSLPASESMSLPEMSGPYSIFSGSECVGQELPSLALSALRIQAAKGTDGSVHYGWMGNSQRSWSLCDLNSYSFLQKPRITLTLPSSISKTSKLSRARWQKPTQKARGTYSLASTSRTSAGTRTRFALSLSRFNPGGVRWISIDWGFKHDGVCYWHATQPAIDSPNGYQPERTVTYRERVFKGVAPYKMAAEIIELSDEFHGRDEFGVERRPTAVCLSPDAWQKRTDEDTIAEQMGDVFARAGWARPAQADDDRMGGWMLMYQLLDSGEWVIGDNCTALIRCLPTLVRDDIKVEDIAKVDGDDAADAARYGLKSRVAPKRKPLEVRINERMATMQAVRVSAGMSAQVDPTAVAMMSPEGKSRRTQAR